MEIEERLNVQLNLPNKSMIQKGEECKGGKRAKDRITVMLCGNAAGEKERALVIGKSKNPRCFKNRDMGLMNFDYYFNRKAWMNSVIFDMWLKKFNRRMKDQKRKVILFLDNAPSHPSTTYSNVKLAFLPANTTSHSQQMDQGIIQAMKLKYRKRQVGHIVREMTKQKEASGTSIFKQINILQAITWVIAAWKDVESSTIIKCFDRYGMLASAPDLDDTITIECTYEEYDTVANDNFNCNFTELVDMDTNVRTCDAAESARDWDAPAQSILDDLAKEKEADDAEESDDTEESDDNDEPDNETVKPMKPPPKFVTNVREAMELIAALKTFADDNSMTSILPDISNVEHAFDLKLLCNVKSATQSKVTDFFLSES